jgi:hypothetical protein
MALKFAVNNSLSAVTTVPTAISDNFGSMTLLQTQTASSSSTIDFTSNIDSTYDVYVFKFINCHPSVDSQAFLSFQADTGTNTNYNQTITSTFFKSLQNEAGTTTALSYDTNSDLAQSTNFQHIGRNTGYDNDQSVSGTLTIYNPSSSVFVKHFIGTTNVYTDDDYSINSFVGGYFNTTTALTRFRFKFASGNIDSGDIKLYGIS